MLIPATVRTAARADRDDRRLRAAYRRELRDSVESSISLLAFALTIAILGLILARQPHFELAATVVAVAATVTVLLATLVRRTARRYASVVGMLVGILAMVPCIANGIAFPTSLPLSIGGLAMVPLAFPLFIPLEPGPHRLWLVLVNAFLFGSLVVLGRGTAFLAGAPTVAVVMLISCALSLMANELITRRRELMNRQMITARSLYRSMREREVDLRRQDEFLLMQQETLVVQQAELLRLNEELEAVARLDALTGIGNRLRLNEDLAQLAGRIERTGGAAGVLLLDLDRFKRLNDCAGHLAGDAALKGVAEVLRRTARIGDGLYRYGGEEFLIVLHDADESVLALAGQRYVSAIQAAGMRHPDNAPWGVVTASAGASELSQRVGVNVDAALRAADEALYRAKARGRNRLEVQSCPEDEAEMVPILQRRAAS